MPRKHFPNVDFSIVLLFMQVTVKLAASIGAKRSYRESRWEQIATGSKLQLFLRGSIGFPCCHDNSSVSSALFWNMYTHLEAWNWAFGPLLLLEPERVIQVQRENTRSQENGEKETSTRLLSSWWRFCCWRNCSTAEHSAPVSHFELPMTVPLVERLLPRRLPWLGWILIFLCQMIFFLVCLVLPDLSDDFHNNERWLKRGCHVLGTFYGYFPEDWSHKG